MTAKTPTDCPEPRRDLSGRVLVVDDEPELLASLRDVLDTAGCEVTTCGSGAEALAALARGGYDVVLTDLRMPGMDGTELLRRAVDLDPNVVGVVMTDQGTAENAVAAMKAGAFDYLSKPFKLATITAVLDRALSVRRLRLDNLQLRQIMAIYELGQTISYTLALEVILDKVADGALQQCEADEASVMLSTEDGAALYVAAVRGEGRDSLLGQRVTLDSHVAGWVARNREPLVLAGEITDPAYRPVQPRPEIRQATSIPLLAGGHLVGVLNVNFLRQRHPLAVGELKALYILASIAAAALHGSQLYQEAQRAGQAARDAQAQLERVLDTMGDGLMVLDAEDRLCRANAQMCTLLGRTEEELLGQPYTAWVHPEGAAEMARQIEQRRQGVSSTYETEFLGAGGEPLHVLVTGTPSLDETGKYAGAVECATDITARRRAEAALRESHEELAALYDNAPTAMVLVDDQLQVRKANRATPRWTERTETDPVGKRLGDAVRCLHALSTPQGCGFGAACETCPVRQSVRETVQTGRRQQRREASLTFGENGAQETREYLVSTAPVQVGNDRLVLVYLDDITDLKRAELSLAKTNADLQSALDQLESSHEQAVRQERLKALGEMASGIAHDFNNALAPILGFTDLLLSVPDRLDDRERTLEYLRTMNTAARDATVIVNRLREFYRKREAEEVHVPLRLEHLCAQALSLTQPRWKDQAQAEGRLIRVHDETEEVPLIAGSASDLREALTNLIFNAVDALPTGGDLTLRTYCLADENTGQPRCVLEVADNGTGMSEETLQRCLDPFFTTKAERGTGLGLAMVHGIVRRHGGELEIDSRLGQGTTFRLLFPGLVDELEAEREEAAALEPVTGLRVLVVDDDEIVRDTTSEYLAEDGHTVVLAANGREGLTAYESDQFDLVLTDRAMPEMGGDQLAAAIRDRNPGQPVLMLTGFGEMMEETGSLPKGVNRVVAKPVSLYKLRKAICEIMEQPLAESA